MIVSGFQGQGSSLLGAVLIVGKSEGMNLDIGFRNAGGARCLGNNRVRDSIGTAISNYIGLVD